jgi:hypothetical protein
MHGRLLPVTATGISTGVNVKNETAANDLIAVKAEFVCVRGGRGL